MSTKTVLITGASSGFGEACARKFAAEGHRLILAARRTGRIEALAKELGEQVDVLPLTLDVRERELVDEKLTGLPDEFSIIDVLVNNAGVIAGGDLLTGPDPMKGALGVNLMGPLQTARAFAPGMTERGWGRIVNVSSTWGSFESGLEGPAAYAISKAALNALTVRLSRELGDGILINAMCPGWVRTRMGGDAASRSVQEGADTAFFLATLPDGSPTGGFFRDRAPIAW